MTDAVLGIDVSIDAAVLGKLMRANFYPKCGCGARNFRTAASALFATNMIWFARIRIRDRRGQSAYVSIGRGDRRLNHLAWEVTLRRLFI